MPPRDGSSFGAPTEVELRLAQQLVAAVPTLEMVRFVSSGTEATMSAVRLARAFTGRDKILKFVGGYHGHVDALLAEAGSGLATLSIPSTPGVPASVTADTLLCQYNDLDAARALAEQHADQLACVIVEPVAGNMGVIPAAAGLPGGPAGDLQRHRGAADRRRGDHRLPGCLRRRPGAAGGARRSHLPGKDRRRRPAGGGLRRPR